MSETVQEWLDGIEATLEEGIQEGRHAFTAVHIGGGRLATAHDFLRSRGRGDLADQMEQNRQAWLAGEVA